MRPQDVSPAIPGNIEMLFAVEALECLLIGMGNFMRLQTAVVFESLLAQITPIDPLPGMCSHVLPIAIVGFEPRFAQLTLIGTFIGMDSTMSQQIGTCGTSFRTELAKIAIVSRMFIGDVLLEIGLVIEERSTNITDECGGMGLQVRFQ